MTSMITRYNKHDKYWEIHTKHTNTQGFEWCWPGSPQNILNWGEHEAGSTFIHCGENTAWKTFQCRGQRLVFPAHLRLTKTTTLLASWKSSNHWELFSQQKIGNYGNYMKLHETTNPKSESQKNSYPCGPSWAANQIEKKTYWQTVPFGRHWFQLEYWMVLVQAENWGMAEAPDCMTQKPHRLNVYITALGGPGRGQVATKELLRTKREGLYTMTYHD